MSTNAAEADPTTDTDEDLLERASQADPNRGALTQTQNASEHPSGRVAAAEAANEGDYQGKAVRRKPTRDQ
jgi:hypothetical protein